jgi:hypothetical protein
LSTQDAKQRRKLAGEIATFLAKERRLDGAGDQILSMAYCWFGRPDKWLWEEALIMAIHTLREYVRAEEIEATLPKPVSEAPPRAKAKPRRRAAAREPLPQLFKL